MGNYCILDDFQQRRQPPEQMTISIHDELSRPGTVYEEPPDDEETPGRSYSDDGYSQGYLDYLRGGGHHPDSDLLSDDYNVRSNDGDGDCAAG